MGVSCPPGAHSAIDDLKEALLRVNTSLIKHAELVLISTTHFSRCLHVADLNTLALDTAEFELRHAMRMAQMQQASAAVDDERRRMDASLNAEIDEIKRELVSSLFPAFAFCLLISSDTLCHLATARLSPTRKRWRYGRIIIDRATNTGRSRRPKSTLATAAHTVVDDAIVAIACHCVANESAMEQHNGPGRSHGIDRSFELEPG